MRFLQNILGPDTCDCTLAYVYDTVVHPPTLELHLEHLDIVLRRLRSASVTVSAEKCHSCRKDFTFLGLVIREGGIAAVLSYPLAENRRQLRQFLDVTNHRHK